MSTSKRSTSPAGAIIDAKTKTASPTPMATPMATTSTAPATPATPGSAVLLRQTPTPLPPQRRTVSQLIQTRSLPVGGMLSDLFKIDASIGNRELLNTNFSNPSVQAKFNNTRMQAVSPEMTDKGVMGAKEIPVSRDEIPTGVRLDDMLQRIYSRADRDGIKTDENFAAAFDDLLKTADPADQKFIATYTQPGNKAMDYQKFKKAAATQFQRLIDDTRR